jgi:hypothetical protein
MQIDSRTTHGHELRKIAAAHAISVDRVAGDDVRSFPVELACSRGAYLLHFFSICAVAGYDWNVDLRVHASAPLIVQFFGAECTIVLQLFNMLMIDVSPRNSGAAGASNNIIRCVPSTITVAVL